MPGDTNGVPDVFLRDFFSGTTRRVSVATGGIQAAAGSQVLGNNCSSVSGGGELVAFASTAPNLVAGDTNASLDVFVHDAAGGGIPANPWMNLGYGLAGAAGVPIVTATGLPSAGEVVTLGIMQASRNATLAYALGGSFLGLSIAGGVLVPNPDLGFVQTTDSSGADALQFTWPSGLPSGFVGYFQAIVIDSSAPQGLAFSNALQVTQ